MAKPMRNTPNDQFRLGVGLANAPHMLATGLWGPRLSAA
jgi:hypothetical protein